MRGAWIAEIADALHGAATSGRYATTVCPRCRDRDGKPNKRKISVNVTNGWFRCWRCDFRGRLPGFDDGANTPIFDAEDDVQELEQWSDYTPAHEPGGHRALAYMTQERNIPEDTVRAAGIGWCARGEHAGRVILPIEDRFGNLVAWQGRRIRAGKGPRYYTAEGSPRGSLFYGEHHVHTGDGPLMVVEGPMDALRHWGRAVAMFGKPSKIQRDRLLAWTHRPLVVVMDGDAWRDGDGLAKWLTAMGHPRAGCVALPAGADPDTFDPGVLRQAVEFVAERGQSVDLR